MTLTNREKRLIQVLLFHKHEWLTSKEIHIDLGERWEKHGFKGVKSVEQVLRRFKLLRRKRFETRETEYFCDFSTYSPKII